MDSYKVDATKVENAENIIMKDSYKEVGVATGHDNKK